MRNYFMGLPLFFASMAQATSGTVSMSITIEGLPSQRTVLAADKRAIEEELGVTPGLVFMYYNFFRNHEAYTPISSRIEAELELGQGSLETFYQENPTLAEQTAFLEELIQE